MECQWKRPYSGFGKFIFLEEKREGKNCPFFDQYNFPQVWRAIPLGQEKALEETYLESLEPKKIGATMSSRGSPATIDDNGGDVEIEIILMRKRYFQSCHLILHCGRLHIFRGRKIIGGETSRVIEVKDIDKVWSEDNKFFFTLLGAQNLSNKMFTFQLRKHEEPWKLAIEWVRAIRYSQAVIATRSQHEILFLIAESPQEQQCEENGFWVPNKKILSLRESGSLVWSIDSHFRITGWEIVQILVQRDERWSNQLSIVEVFWKLIWIEIWGFLQVVIIKTITTTPFLSPLWR